jgi:hypothetical protein
MEKVFANLHVNTLFGRYETDTTIKPPGTDESASGLLTGNVGSSE